MNLTKFDHVILLAHGSPDKVWKKPFEALQASVEEKCGKGKTSLAFMELTQPTLEEVVLGLPQAGRIAELPIFLAVGRHLRLDVPKQIKALETEALSIELLKPVGDSPILQRAMLEIIAYQLDET